jgi:hypothetical protein
MLFTWLLRAWCLVTNRTDDPAGRASRRVAGFGADNRWPGRTPNRDNLCRSPIEFGHLKIQKHNYRDKFLSLFNGNEPFWNEMWNIWQRGKYSQFFTEIKFNSSVAYKPISCNLIPFDSPWKAPSTFFWTRFDPSKRSATNSRKRTSGVRSFHRLRCLGGFAAKCSVRSRWTEKTFDRGLKELSNDV